jgi:hypothetical protein
MQCTTTPQLSKILMRQFLDDVRTTLARPPTTNLKSPNTKLCCSPSGVLQQLADLQLDSFQPVENPTSSDANGLAKEY